MTYDEYKLANPWDECPVDADDEPRMGICSCCGDSDGWNLDPETGRYYCDYCNVDKD